MYRKKGGLLDDNFTPYSQVKNTLLSVQTGEYTLHTIASPAR
jgi:hypothetical protein